MQNEGQFTLTLLHDLALLYLGLAHGADADLDPSETRAIAAKLRRWQPDKDPALIDHVIREATLTYLNGTNQSRLHDAVEVLRDALSENLRVRILNDLADIARADGEIVNQEQVFIDQIADQWGIDLDQATRDSSS